LPEKKMDVSTSHVPLLVLSRWSFQSFQWDHRNVEATAHRSGQNLQRWSAKMHGMRLVFSRQPAPLQYVFIWSCNVSLGRLI
jgi:hypothetical protein